MLVEIEQTLKKSLEISKLDFIAFERVRHSGVTNMVDIVVVSKLSGLNKEKILAIMDNYDKLEIEYPDVRKD